MLPHRRGISRRLQELTNLAADWVQQLDSLLPIDDHEAIKEWCAPSRQAVEDKILAEAAMLLEVTHRACEADEETAKVVRIAYDRLLSAIDKRGRPERHWQLLSRAPHVAWPVGITHAILQRHGALNEPFDEFLRACLELGWNDTVDRSIFRSLEMRWAQSLLEGGPPLAEELFRMAPATATLPLSARREDLYAFTHTLFYVTNFGAYPLPGWVDLGEIAARVDAFLAWQLWEDDLDLLGELLMVAYSCRVPSLYATTALTVMWDDLCTPVVRGPFTDFRFDRLHATNDPHIFGRCYHTTFVAGMLCATLLITKPNTANSHLSDRERSLVTKQSLDALRIVRQRARLDAAWTTRIERVDDNVQNIIACVLDGAIAAACRTGDIPATRSLIDGARREVARTTLTARCATELLELRNLMQHLMKENSTRVSETLN